MCRDVRNRPTIPDNAGIRREPELPEHEEIALETPHSQSASSSFADDEPDG